MIADVLLLPLSAKTKDSSVESGNSFVFSVFPCTSLHLEKPLLLGIR